MSAPSVNDQLHAISVALSNLTTQVTTLQVSVTALATAIAAIPAGATAAQVEEVRQLVSETEAVEMQVQEAIG